MTNLFMGTRNLSSTTPTRRLFGSLVRIMAIQGEFACDARTFPARMLLFGDGAFRADRL
jgi:hypothetical protein